MNGYTDYRGGECLRNTYAKYYNNKIKKTKFDIEDIQITLGASDAIMSCLMTICLNKNDKVLLIEPFFSDYKLYCKMLNIKYTSIHIKDIINKKVKNMKKCKAILFSNPNNPSGYVFNKEEIENIIRLAKKYGLYIISDEVYSEIIYDSFISFAEYDYEKIIIVDSVSKKFNNCGARIGCIITKNSKLINNLAKIYDSRISISNTEQLAVCNMFNNMNEIFKENIFIYTKRRDAVLNFLERQNIIEYEIPKGGVFFVLTLPVEDSEVFANWLLNKYRKDNETLAILPANDFYNGEKNKIRLPMTNDSNYIIYGLNILIDALKKYRKDQEKQKE